jgi:hypothetical protein
MPKFVPQTALAGRSQSGRDRLAKNLGYFSIALGIAEIVAPKALCNAVGIRGLENVVRAYGAREIATGVAILASHDPEPWIWGRVAGDMADIATVATGLQQGNMKMRSNAMALAALAAVTALDWACAQGLNSQKGDRETAVADYSNRSGFPRGIQAAWGAARNAPTANDKRTPGC